MSKELPSGVKSTGEIQGAIKRASNADSDQNKFPVGSDLPTEKRRMKKSKTNEEEMERQSRKGTVCAKDLRKACSRNLQFQFGCASNVR